MHIVSAGSLFHSLSYSESSALWLSVSTCKEVGTSLVFEILSFVLTKNVGWLFLNVSHSPDKI